MKFTRNVKKTSNLIKDISMELKSTSKKSICHSVPKTFDFSWNFFVLFHRVTFDYSVSCVVLIDKPNERL